MRQQTVSLALGFDGYPQFRAELVHGFESMMAAEARIRR